MTRLDAESIPDLHLLTRCMQSEEVARLVVLERAAKFSPGIEEVSEGTACAFVLDITGSERLFGPQAQMAERLRADLAAAGFRVSVAVSSNFPAARMKAAATRGVTVIPEGAEAVALAKLPLTMLKLDEEPLETFAVWGIRTLGELAALPEIELITRMGQQARTWRDAAWGILPHTFQPIEAKLALNEFFAFDTPVEEVDSVLFICARMIDALVERASDRAMAIARLTVTMKLEGGAAHELKLRPAIPSADRKFLVKLLHLEIASHPPQDAVLSLELNAEAAQSNLVQLGLFIPQMPEPSRLDVTIARLKAIVGDDRVGSPVLEDTNRPGSFRMEPFAVYTPSPAQSGKSARLALRRMRPPLSIRVIVYGAEPVVFSSAGDRFEVTAAYGPWRTAGNWWSVEPWNIEEWDVMAVRNDGAPIACLLVHDKVQNQWQLEAMYD